MCLPSSSGDQLASAAPSRRTAPRASGHTPVSARARVDLPAALGPITASTVPALIVEADVR